MLAICRPTGGIKARDRKGAGACPYLRAATEGKLKKV
jgi:hypothetical protein